MRCPYCHHAHGLHSGPGTNGRAADGGLLAPDYECGKCHQGDCQCPGWYPDLTAMEMTAATIAARAERNTLVDDLPFALRPKIGKRTTVQGGLF